MDNRRTTGGQQAENRRTTGGQQADNRRTTGGQWTVQVDEVNKQTSDDVINTNGGDKTKSRVGDNIDMAENSNLLAC